MQNDWFYRTRTFFSKSLSDYRLIENHVHSTKKCQGQEILSLILKRICFYQFGEKESLFFNEMKRKEVKF